MARTSRGYDDGARVDISGRWYNRLPLWTFEILVLPP